MRTFAVLACLLSVAAATTNIVQVASATPSLSTLVTALKAANLVTALEGNGPFTVFAPDNNAFAKVPAATLTQLLAPQNIQQLQALLKYHVVSGAAVYSKDLKPTQNVQTLEGNQLLIEVNNGKVTINQNSQVTTADVAASNGVVHIVDTVFVIPTTTTPTPPSQNIVQLAAATPSLSTLVTALTAAKLVTALEGNGPFTVFAPDNNAFAKVPAATLTQLLAPKNIQRLQALLQYHVVSGAAVYSKDLKPTQNVQTLEGNQLLIEVNNGKVTINQNSQ